MTKKITLAEHLDLNLEVVERSQKPRTKGITMVCSDMWSSQVEKSLLEAYGEFVDSVKFVDQWFDSPLEEMKQKIRVFHEHDVAVQPGGIMLEIARLQNKGEEVLRKLRDLGCDQVEISASTSSTDRTTMDEDVRFTELAKNLGFQVLGEVGKKISEGDISRSADDQVNVEETVRQMKALLAAGANKIYWEGHLLRRVIGETPSEIIARQEIATPQIMAVANEIGADNIVFEVSALVTRKTRRALQFWLTRMFGPDVNMGNCRLEEVGAIEAIRKGRYPIFGFGPAGDMPWMKALEVGKGKVSPEWWKAAAVYETPVAP